MIDVEIPTKIKLRQSNAGGMYLEDESRIVLALDETVTVAAPMPTHHIHCTPAKAYCTKSDLLETIGDMK